MNIYEYNDRLNRLMIIENCVSLICFTVLAITFNHWWILFFSLLFITSALNVDLLFLSVVIAVFSIVKFSKVWVFITSVLLFILFI